MSGSGGPGPPGEHPFVGAPHRTLVALSLPVLLSLIAEPLTGLADTAFVARLGAEPLAALGVGTSLLSSIFWVFNFLSIGAQTEVARASGAGDTGRGRAVCGLALVLSAAFGLAMTFAGIAAAGGMASVMGASGEVREAAMVYLRIRLLGAPAVIVTATAFGALRGLQDMRTPLWIAVSVNVLNVVLDALLIFGAGPIPALGIAGAAWATTGSHWLGAAWALFAVRARLGFPARLHLGDAVRLLVVGRDLFVRTGLLMAFLLLATRSATRIGPDAGAAHQAIRQVWMFTALVLDAFAHTAQSLVGYFLGRDQIRHARHVALVACAWSLGTGVALAAGMALLRVPVAALLVPLPARALFAPAWLAAALAQPLNALSFATDGVHWGTSDYRFLRNAMLFASGVGMAALWLLDERSPGALTLVWAVTGGWITLRALLGAARIWPGIGRPPLRTGTSA